ncbi:iron-sulfur cluster carrier protein ApbC [Tatumella sp. TA1]|uniref:iron-sulfur cluster carrier protein ApbC n=1 Tax=Rosenbergiella collisarenosi TaxID=1544695 RepID=UPI0008F7FAAD|nr:iron-sulfur cluster carrier protein ApbC [Rosenbergiella collisarenosi]QGX91787.1 iron-sulfur cluster carrier protein ApbC [Tatumella sp. TA1]
MSFDPSHSHDLRDIVNPLLAEFSHPTLRKNLVELGAIRHAVLLDQVLHIELTLPFAWPQGSQVLKAWASPQLCEATGATAVDWHFDYAIATLQRVKKLPGCRGVKNIIAVSSGKGGVGKSSTALNVALALATPGVKVGVLDADIYGPSIPQMLGTAEQRPSSPDGKHMAPILSYGLATNSIGYLVTDDNAMIWRGPMASKALLQLLNETLWPDLDYLVVDMPPGTGDIQLTLAQNIPVTGAVVVTTPQDVALLDARKGVVMFNKVDVPVLGIVENMSIHICQNCGHQEAIFGHEGAQGLSTDYGIPVLGKIPLHIQLREDLDAGIPTVVRDPSGAFSDLYREIADNIATELYWQGEVIPEDIAIRTL